MREVTGMEGREKKCPIFCISVGIDKHPNQLGHDVRYLHAC